ncbi:ABC transporter permease [Desulfosarcina ovata]|uniref:ABC transporter permease n=2 Tax=Desulfosarcina ovata TaxID=83564 RepID=A0A5K8AAI4_9BACT|nr:ABC transporter permease [Desulfosarcina ovata]BBO82324.1 ABC transporter permease [Desulfosarcina ovata subsp. sediminis]BBO89531.1 ABC transporter permease [Desulfosarcina ovata subsp. ovata]
MLWETILLAQREIRRNALRSSLTILGIVIGVASVITLVTLGGGATAKVTADISKLGSNLLQVRPGQRLRGPGGTRSGADNFEIADAVAIENEISGLAAVAPAANSSTQAIYGSTNWTTSITGSTNAFLKVRNWQLDMGRIFSGHELQAGGAVCIIGATVRKELFGAQDPTGESIRLKTLTFKVIGVLGVKGQSNFGSDQDDFILIPMLTFQRRISGNRDVSTIYLSARDGVSTEKIKADIEGLMRQRRQITGNKEDDFYVRDMQEIMSTLTGTTRVLTTLLGAVAAVSLLVGGIGIMNIMLVSVTERTREIGIRLAIGALARQVLMQFLIEAVVLSAFGGLVGISLGLGAAAIGAHILKVPFILNSGVIVIAFLFSAIVGVLFGYFPARQAARLDPIDALRYE